MSRGLPAGIRAALDGMLEGVVRKDLARRAGRISANYRQRGASAATIADDHDALAYAVTRMPATHAAVRAALETVAARCPDLVPRSLLDLGAGPGTATWAALELWPGIGHAMLVDSSGPLLALASRLADHAHRHCGRLAFRREAIAARLAAMRAAGETCDLVILSYTLAEAPVAGIASLAGLAGGVARQAVLVVEPGTPDGHARVLTAREALVAAGMTVAAPCLHSAACPLAAPDWCHFSVRLPRSRDHLLVKGAEVPFEDERYAYVAAVRGLDLAVVPPGQGRVLRPPLVEKSAVGIEVCTARGISRLSVGRHDKKAFKAARKVDWGDLWPGGLPASDADQSTAAGSVTSTVRPPSGDGPS